MEKKRYWLKLDKDFLKSPQIKVIKNMPNGKDYIIFYLSLLLESIETIGHLRFSNLVPYNEEMLSSVTDTNVDVVRTAMKLFLELGLVEILDDGTIYMTQVAQMTGKESESAERVRQYRLRKKEEEQKQLMLHCNDNVTKSNDNKEKEEEEDKDKQSTENNEDKHNKEKKEESVSASVSDASFNLSDTPIGELLNRHELKSLELDENNVYNKDTYCIQENSVEEAKLLENTSVPNLDTDCIHSIDKNSTDEDSIEKSSTDEDSINNNQISPKTSSLSKKELEKQLTKEFDKLWEYYPNKKGKEEAIKKRQQRLKKRQEDNLRDNTGTKCLTEYRDKSIEYRDKILDIDKEIELNNNTSLPAPTSPSKKDILLQYENEFEKLWEHYPNKKGKDQAKNKYLLARKQGITYELIAQGLKNYLNYIKSENIELKYIKHGSTWFNQKCWNDDYKITSSSNQKVDEQMEFLKGVHNGTIKIN